MNDGGGVTSFELNVAPDGPLVPTVRRFVGELCGRVLSDVDITSKVVVATHELLDNALRYSSREVRSTACSAPTMSAIRVEVRRLGLEAAVVIVTKNRVNEDRRRDLERIIDEMNASRDRAAFYEGLLQRAAQSNDGGGLGLGRVHAEADFLLSTRFEDDQVVIRAEGRFPLAAR